MISQAAHGLQQTWLDPVTGFKLPNTSDKLTLTTGKLRAKCQFSGKEGYACDQPQALEQPPNHMMCAVCCRSVEGGCGRRPEQLPVTAAVCNNPISKTHLYTMSLPSPARTARLERSDMFLILLSCSTHITAQHSTRHSTTHSCGLQRAQDSQKSRFWA